MANLPPSKLTAETLLTFRKSLGYSQRVFGIRLAEINSLRTHFTRGYISNLETGKQPITGNFETAVLNLLEFESTPLVALIRKTIRHKPGQVATNSIYGGKSKLCNRPSCKNSFIPTSPNQKQCPECKRRRRRS